VHATITPPKPWKHTSPSPHSGSASLPPHTAAHVPSRVTGSTPQQNEPTSQSSKPLHGPSCTVHVPPAATGSGVSSVQRVARHDEVGSPLPSATHGTHLSPSGQSCAQISQSDSDRHDVGP